MKQTTTNWLAECEEALRALDQERLKRTFRTCTIKTAREGEVNGKKCILFSTNDYLGLSKDQRLIDRACSIIKEEGVGSGASRLLSGTSVWHTKLEKKIADWKKKEAALVFGSGYAANLSVLATLASEKDIIFLDKLCHASLIDAAHLSGATIRVYPHFNLKRLEELLEQSFSYRRRFIVTDTVFSMDGDVAPLAQLIELKKRFDALLIIDEAHGTGVFGPIGEGVAEAQGVANDVDVTIGTLSKAVGVLGGFVAGSKTLIDYLLNHARPFIFTTAFPAALAAAACDAIEIIERDQALRKNLWDRTRELQTELKKLNCDIGASVSPIVPVIVGEPDRALELQQYLLDNGFYVPAIRPPAVGRKSSRLRCSVTAAHTKEDIQQVTELLKKALSS